MKHLLAIVVLHNALWNGCVAQMDGDGMPPMPPPSDMPMMFDEQPMEFMVGDPMSMPFVGEEQSTFDNDFDMPNGAEPFVGAESPIFDGFGGAPVLPMPEDQSAGFEQPASFDRARSSHMWSINMMRANDAQVNGNIIIKRL